MQMTVAAFDFDGTLTDCDTFIRFIRYAKGTLRLVTGFTLYMPLIVLYKTGLYPNYKVKQKIFAHYFRGMPLSQFDELCQGFFENNKDILSPSTCAVLKQHQAQGHTTVIISASIEDWVTPFARHLGVEHTLATKIETDGEDCITGRFLTPNCHGQEKVNRLSALYPDRHSYTLYAYGDSSGDSALLAYADHPHLVK